MQFFFLINGWIHLTIKIHLTEAEQIIKLDLESSSEYHHYFVLSATNSEHLLK